MPMRACQKCDFSHWEQACSRQVDKNIRFHNKCDRIFRVSEIYLVVIAKYWILISDHICKGFLLLYRERRRKLEIVFIPLFLWFSSGTQAERKRNCQRSIKMPFSWRCTYWDTLFVKYKHRGREIFEYLQTMLKLEIFEYLQARYLNICKQY